MLCPAAHCAAAGSPSASVTIDEYEIRLEDGLIVVSTPGGFANSPIGEPALPWKHFFLSADHFAGTGSPRLVIRQADTIRLAAPLAPTLPPVQTRGESTPSAGLAKGPVDFPSSSYPPESCRLALYETWRGQPVLSILWCPFRYYPQQNLLQVIRWAEIRVSADGPAASQAGFITPASAEVGHEDLWSFYRNDFSLIDLARASTTEQARTIQTGTPTEVDYVIITNEALTASLHPLAEWRQKQGYRVGIALIAEITSTYPGEDVPAQVRAYLSAAYAGGLQFCVLGGDETVIPIRYAYHGYTDSMPAYENMQICDLYYADLTGEWDTDGDGIYGEHLHDSADVYPEIYLGRLLAADAQQMETIVEKILTYETNPGSGDPSYLTRALFTCADQMRDWNNGEGQHTIIGSNFPEHFELDLASQAENPTGSLPDPQTPEGAGFVEQAGLGWGWITVINHGRADGFILRSAGINEWPKSYVWTSGSNGDGHGHLNLLSAGGPPGIFLSVACNFGGFDMDGPLFGGFWGFNVSELLAQKPNGGAVAVIAHSRWGWVGSSYLILSKFAEYAFDPTVPQQIGVALTLAKTNFPYYRDQNFGLNLYGDPAMPYWRDLPQVMEADFPTRVTVGSGSVEFSVTHGGSPLTGAWVTAAYADTVLFVGETDVSGIVAWISGPDRLGGHDITISKPGFLPLTSQLIVPIVAGFDDEEGGSPLPLALGQNHPNPFNPTTTIDFVIPVTEQVCLNVYDVLGRRVTTLINDVLPAGRHNVIFDGKDKYGSPLASGVYFYRLHAGKTTELKKMVLLR